MVLLNISVSFLSNICNFNLICSKQPLQTCSLLITHNLQLCQVFHKQKSPTGTMYSACRQIWLSCSWNCTLKYNSSHTLGTKHYSFKNVKHMKIVLQVWAEVFKLAFFPLYFTGGGCSVLHWSAKTQSQPLRIYYAS